MYVKCAVDVGMVVNCCREYERVSVGCEGKVIKIMREGGLHDLNVKVPTFEIIKINIL